MTSHDHSQELDTRIQELAAETAELVSSSMEDYLLMSLHGSLPMDSFGLDDTNRVVDRFDRHHSQDSKLNLITGIYESSRTPQPTTGTNPR